MSKIQTGSAEKNSLRSNSFSFFTQKHRFRSFAPALKAGVFLNLLQTSLFISTIIYPLQQPQKATLQSSSERFCTFSFVQTKEKRTKKKNCRLTLRGGSTGSFAASLFGFSVPVILSCLSCGCFWPLFPISCVR